MNNLVEQISIINTMNIIKYIAGIGGIASNLVISFPSFMAGVMSSGTSLPNFIMLYNIPLIPGYMLTAYGFGRYVLVGEIMFQNLLYPAINVLYFTISHLHYYY